MPAFLQQPMSRPGEDLTLSSFPIRKGNMRAIISIYRHARSRNGLLPLQAWAFPLASGRLYLPAILGGAFFPILP